MNNGKAVIAKTLKSDDELRDLLGNRQSIQPAGMLKGDSKFPAVTIQEGPLVRDGEFKLINEFYIRVYDEKPNGTININPIGLRINELLDRKEFELIGARFIKIRFEDSLGEQDDPTLNKNFIQYRYRIHVV